MRGSIEVHHFLVERSVAHEFYRLERPLRRIDEASAVLGLDPRIVVSAEMFEAPGGKVLALTPSSTCASAEAVARAAGVRRVRPMSKARSAAYTGYNAEWLPPFGHERPSFVVIDRSLLNANVLYAAGGDTGVMIVMRSDDLVRATSAIPVDIVASEETPSSTETPASAAS